MKRNLKEFAREAAIAVLLKVLDVSIVVSNRFAGKEAPKR